MNLSNDSIIFVAPDARIERFGDFNCSNTSCRSCPPPTTVGFIRTGTFLDDVFKDLVRVLNTLPSPEDLPRFG